MNFRLRSWSTRLLLIGLLVALLAVYTPVLAQGGVVVRTGNNMRLRAEPSTEGAVLASVPAGTSLPAATLSEDQSWVAVTFEGQNGWLALAYLAVESGSLAELPVSNALAPAAPAEAAPPAPVEPVVANLAVWLNEGTTLNAVNSLRMRAEPSANARLITTIPANTPLPALALSADALWVQTVYNGQAGWVYRANVYEYITDTSLDDLVGVPPMTAYEFSLSMAQQVVILVNQARASIGLGQLGLNDALNAAALRHANDMATNAWFDHTGTDGSNPSQRGEQAGYGPYVGENIAQLYSLNAREVFWMWMNSPGHRANILDGRYTDMGLACTVGAEYAVYCAQEFGFH